MGPGLAATGEHVSSETTGTSLTSNDEPEEVQHTPAPLSPTSTPVSEAVSEPTPLAGAGFRQSDRWFLFGATILVTMLVGVHWMKIRGWGLQPLEIVRPPDAPLLILDINEATWVEWMQLDGIGETLARRIVTDRETRGPFADISDLTRVSGIGPKTLERIRPYLKGQPARSTDSR